MIEAYQARAVVTAHRSDLVLGSHMYLSLEIKSPWLIPVLSAILSYRTYCRIVPFFKSCAGRTLYETKRRAIIVQFGKCVVARSCCVQRLCYWFVRLGCGCRWLHGVIENRTRTTVLFEKKNGWTVICESLKYYEWMINTRETAELSNIRVSQIYSAVF